MVTLRDPSRISDPFREACRIANSPGGLLGKHPAEALLRLQNYVGTQIETWTVREWQRAAEILAYLVDEREKRQREADETRQLAAAPKKRGPKPKRRTPLRGLLDFGRGPGRPRKLSEVQERLRLRAFLKLKAELERQKGHSLTDKTVAIVLCRAHYDGQRASVATRKAEALRKDVSDWRQKYGLSLRKTQSKKPR